MGPRENWHVNFGSRLECERLSFPSPTTRIPMVHFYTPWCQTHDADVAACDAQEDMFVPVPAPVAAQRALFGPLWTHLTEPQAERLSHETTHCAESVKLLRAPAAVVRAATSLRLQHCVVPSTSAQTALGAREDDELRVLIRLPPRCAAFRLEIDPSDSLTTSDRDSLSPYRPNFQVATNNRSACRLVRCAEQVPPNELCFAWLRPIRVQPFQSRLRERCLGS